MKSKVRLLGIDVQKERERYSSLALFFFFYFDFELHKEPTKFQHPPGLWFKAKPEIL
jgi:hypothetical protein